MPKFHFFWGPLYKSVLSQNSQVILFCTASGPLTKTLRYFCASPRISHSGAPGQTHHKICPSLFKEILGVGTYISTDLCRGPQGLPTLKILQLCLRKFSPVKKVVCIRPGRPYDPAKWHLDTLSPGGFTSNKTQNSLPA